MGIFSDIWNGIKYVVAVKPYGEEESYYDHSVTHGFRNSEEILFTANISEAKAFHPLNPLRFIVKNDLEQCYSKVVFKKVMPLKQNFSGKLDTKEKR